MVRSRPMHAHKLDVTVAEDHRLAVDLPADFPQGPAEVIILATVRRERKMVRVLGSLASAAPPSVEDDPVVEALNELRRERAQRFDSSNDPEAT